MKCLVLFDRNLLDWMDRFVRLLNGSLRNLRRILLLLLDIGLDILEVVRGLFVLRFVKVNGLLFRLLIPLLILNYIRIWLVLLMISWLLDLDVVI